MFFLINLDFVFVALRFLFSGFLSLPFVTFHLEVASTFHFRIILFVATIIITAAVVITTTVIFAATLCVVWDNKTDRTQTSVTVKFIKLDGVEVVKGILP